MVEEALHLVERQLSGLTKMIKVNGSIVTIMEVLSIKRPTCSHNNVYMLVAK